MPSTIEATIKTASRKQFSRSNAPRNFEITEWALAMNADVVRHPLIRKDQLRERHHHIGDRTFDQIVSNFFQNGFWSRPDAQKQVRFTGAGSQPAYLAADQWGYQLHLAFYEDPVPYPKYGQDSKWDNWSYIKHEHNTSTALLAYEAHAQTIPGLRFSTQADLWSAYAPEGVLNQPIFDLASCPRMRAHEFKVTASHQMTKTPAKIPLQLSAKLDWKLKLPGSADFETRTVPVTTQPDGYFALTYDRSRPSFFFFFESDEGNETIVPNQGKRHSPFVFRDTSLFAKSLAYIAAYRKRSHVKQFGIPYFQVIFETPTPQWTLAVIRKLAPVLLAPPLSIHAEFIRVVDRATLPRFDNNRYHSDVRYMDLKGREAPLIDVPHTA